MTTLTEQETKLSALENFLSRHGLSVVKSTPVEGDKARYYVRIRPADIQWDASQSEPSQDQRIRTAEGFAHSLIKQLSTLGIRSELTWPSNEPNVEIVEGGQKLENLSENVFSVVGPWLNFVKKSSQNTGSNLPSQG